MTDKAQGRRPYICKHDQIGRSCNICDLEEEVQEQQKEINRLRKERWDWNEGLLIFMGRIVISFNVSVGMQISSSGYKGDTKEECFSHKLRMIKAKRHAECYLNTVNNTYKAEGHRVDRINLTKWRPKKMDVLTYLDELEKRSIKVVAIPWVRQQILSERVGGAHSHFQTTEEYLQVIELERSYGANKRPY